MNKRQLITAWVAGFLLLIAVICHFMYFDFIEKGVTHYSESPLIFNTLYFAPYLILSIAIFLICVLRNRKK